MELKLILKRFTKKKTAVFGLILLTLFLMVAFVGPLFAPYDPYLQDYTAINQPSSMEHLLGTDYLGRDTLSRMIYGCRISLGISFFGVMGGAAVGVILGVISGYFGKWVDTLVNAVLTIILSFPGLLMAIIIITILGSSTINTMIAIMIFNVPTMARTVRGQTFSLREQEYVQACKVMGASHARIIVQHIIPNCLSLIIVNCTLNFGTAILTAAGLSFLGIGVQPPTPEWGAMISMARDLLRTYPQGVLYPGIAITLVVMGFSLTGDGLRDALDPKLKNL